MGKIIRRTIIITITETWTFVWATADEPPKQAPTVVQAKPNPKEELHENLQALISYAEPGHPNPSEPTAASFTSGAALDPPPEHGPVRGSVSRQRKPFVITLLEGIRQVYETEIIQQGEDP